MKKILKATTKKHLKRLKNSDSLFTKDVMSLDDKKNMQYLDNFSYQIYLINLDSESGDIYEQQPNCNYLPSNRKNARTKKDRK